MKSLRNISYILIGIIIGISSIVLFSYKQNPTDSSSIENPINEEIPTSQKGTISSGNYKVSQPYIPQELSFCNEPVPLKNIDVKERLDREILVNTFWHSQTFLLIKRASRYFPIIEPILQKNNIPDDFKYLAVIESGLDNVTSPAGAKGVWQFMKTTAVGYGLEVSNEVDERYHLEKSTSAACQYLQSAYDQFGNWTLAAASYNMGKSGLNNKLEEQKVKSYYDLLLNIETGRYLYRILAAKLILANPLDYGFYITEEELYTPYQTKQITIDSSITNIAEFAIKLNTNYKTVKLLNPWLRSNSLTISKDQSYQLLLPTENANLNPTK